MTKYVNKKDYMFEDLIIKAQEELKISSASTAAYIDKKEILLEFVNKELGRHPRLDELLGQNPLQMMYDNHSNHINFMINVFKLNNFEMLVRIVPWVYRSYHAHGFSYDYFIEELNVWKKANTANLQKSVAAEINAVYDWLLKQHETMIVLSKIEPAYILIEVSSEWREVQKRFQSFLLDGDFEACLRMSEEIVKSPEQIKDFYIQVLQTSLYRVGDFWEKGKISVAEEHLATAIVGRIIANIYTRFWIKKGGRGKILITSAPNEFHEIGSRMVADLMELDGWNVYYLGANTPKEELFKLLKKIRPEILGISVSMPFNIDKAIEIIMDIKKDKDMNRIKIMVGGIAFNTFPELWRSIGADGWAPDGMAAVNLANKLVI